MSYTKTNWVDNTTPINETNLNKIEQGIYDNSLVVDAVTNTLNPTDTETYKTAELTEGQITDVIGVNDIVIKGQTEQDGIPTPSAPVDINVVSGSNVIEISNKNLINISNFVTTNVGITITKIGAKWIINGTATADNIFKFEPISAKNLNGKYALSINYISGSMSGNPNFNVRNKSTDSVILFTSLTTSNTSNTATLNTAIKFGIYITRGSTFNNYTFYPMLETGSTATTYEPHQGKELPLDLPVENLFGGTLEQGGFDAIGLNVPNSIRIRSQNYTEVKENQIYTISTTEYNTTKGTILINISFYTENDYSTARISESGWKSLPYTFTTPENCKFIRFIFKITSSLGDSVIVDTDVNNVQLEQGSKANAYTPYGTDPIELCKIGNYQDYFYKSGSKWYLHKETIKTIINGSADQTIDYSNYLNALVYTNSNIANVSQSSLGNIICNRAVEIARNTVTTNNGICLNDVANRIVIKFDGVSSYNTEALAREYFANNPYEVIYKASTTTNTEITNTTLISQLEAIYNAPLYEETNITQTNNDLPMVLDITACKDNINGIKAFIRK